MKVVGVISSPHQDGNSATLVREALGAAKAAGADYVLVPRVLADLFWFGRYAERAEDLLRLILATRTVAIETDMDLTPVRVLQQPGDPQERRLARTRRSDQRHDLPGRERQLDAA